MVLRLGYVYVTVDCASPSHAFYLTHGHPDVVFIYSAGHCALCCMRICIAFARAFYLTTRLLEEFSTGAVPFVFSLRPAGVLLITRLHDIPTTKEWAIATSQQ